MKNIFILLLIMCCALSGCGSVPSRTQTESAVTQSAGSNSPALDADTSIPEAEDSSSASSAQTSSESDAPAFFTVPEMDKEQQAIYDESVKPLLLTGLLINSWSVEDFSAISFIPETSSGSALIFAYEDIVGQEQMRALWDKYGTNLPASEIEPLLLARFPFTREQLHQILSNYYRPDLDIYEYESGRGGGPVEAAVTGIEAGENGTLMVDYAVYAGYSDEFTTPEHDAYLIRTSGTLTLIPGEDGAIRCHSVKVNERLDFMSRE